MRTVQLSPRQTLGSLLRWIFILGFSWVVFTVLWIVSPIGKPIVEFQIASTQSGFSQLFFANDSGQFTERDSRWSPVLVGPNSLGFSLLPQLLRGGSELRWDPLDRPAEIEVLSITFQDAFRAQTLNLSELRPSLDVSEISIEEGNARFAVQSNDPQMLIAEGQPDFVISSIARAAAVGLLVAIVVTGITIVATKRRYRQRVDATTSGIERTVASQLGDNLVPRWVSLFAVGFLSLGLAMLIYGSQVTGVSWDEPIRASALAEFFRSGWLVPRGDFISGIPNSTAAAVYGPVALLIGHLFVVTLTDAPLWMPALSPEAYEARHLAVAAMAAMTLGAVGLIARKLFGGWRWSVVAAASLAALPLWLGHGFFNIKDVPVAAGFTVFTLALVYVSEPCRDPRSSWLGVLYASLGVVLAIGSRPGIWLALAASIAGTVTLLLVLEGRVNRWRRAGISAAQRIAPLAAGAALGYLILWLIYPLAFGKPLQLLAGSASESQSFTSGGGETLTAGIVMPTTVPWTYVPLWLGAQLPVILAILAIIGIGWLVAGYVNSALHGNPVDPSVRTAIPVVLQAIIVPVGALVLGASLYGGVRQLLFIFPAIAVMAVFGLSRITAWIKASERVWLFQLTWAVAIIGLAIPLFSQIRLFPYNFAYFNAAASVSDVDQNWDIDGWWLSGRELVEGQQLPDRTICVDSEERFVTSCSRMGMITPFLGEPDNSAIELGEDQYVALSRFPYSVGPDVCTPFREVTRGLFFQEVQLSHADVCTATLGEYAAGGLSFSSLTNPDPVLLWGWNPYLLWGWGAPDSNGVWMVEPEASVGFLLDDDRARPSELTITGAGSALAADGTVLRIFVNGVDAGTIPLPSDGQSQVSTIAIPEQAWQGLGEGRVVVRLAAEDVDPLALDAGIDSGAPGLFRIENLAAQ